MKSGFIAIVGRPNVGKSTLMNAILNKKVVITSNKPQTTRNAIQGIYHEDEVQIIFIDTPGIHKPNHKLGTYLNKSAYNSTNSVDAIILIVDINSPWGKGDDFVLDKIKNTKPIILVLNKIDKLKKEDILAKIDEYKDKYPFSEIVPVSALKKDNIKTLIEVMKKYLTDNIPYYEKNQITNQPLTFRISEIIREKAFIKTKEEVPHSLTCVVDNIEKKKNKYFIQASIIVDRESLKKIIIGKNGSMIKEIGINSRIELENLLDSKVYLELYVKVIKKWRDKEKYLQEFGFHEE